MPVLVKKSIKTSLHLFAPLPDISNGLLDFLILFTSKLISSGLGYSLYDFFSCIQSDNINLSLNVQNAFVIASYTGSDPEPALFDLLDGNPLAPGIDRRNSYYSNRSFTLGLNDKF